MMQEMIDMWQGVWTPVRIKHSGSILFGALVMHLFMFSAISHCCDSDSLKTWLCQVLSVALKIVGHSAAVKKLDLSENDFGIEALEVLLGVWGKWKSYLEVTKGRVVLCVCSMMLKKKHPNICGVFFLFFGTIVDL